MNNEQLLVIAKAMGLNVDITNSKKVEYVRVTIRRGCSRKFNPSENDSQFKAVFKWLLTKGDFTLLSSAHAVYVYHRNSVNNHDVFRALFGDFTDNILSIAFQVASELTNGDNK